MSTYTAFRDKARTFVAVLTVAAGLFALAPHAARAEVASMENALKEMSIGKADAPVVMNDYSSLTCPHCAAFHTTTLNQIKKDYVDTGKVRVVFHDFPLDRIALAAMMLTRCAGPERSVDLYDMLYQTQGNWTKSGQPLPALTALVRFYGLGEDDVLKCLENQDLMQTILDRRESASKQYGINSTPSFVIDGKKLDGNLDYGDFRKALDKALADRGVK
ncbi:MAG: DsbA family protein [Alphaproteobacteria bacterium]|nr:DsbA family protein [Alphaproteobacteria bacterium]